MQELWESLMTMFIFMLTKQEVQFFDKAKVLILAFVYLFIMSDEIRKEILGNEWDGFIFVSRKFQYKYL